MKYKLTVTLRSGLQLPTACLSFSEVERTLRLVWDEVQSFSVEYYDADEGGAV